jgi:DNA (cytosine-5)-methyltransferase 1
MKPTLLDLCCRKGGAAAGYIRAGFNVVGVDIENHSDGYPGEFVQGDAVKFVERYGGNFDAVHISAPCQDNIAITAANRKRKGWTDYHVNLLPDFREAVMWAVDSRTPVVLENGPSKAIRPDLVLCGLSFGLPTLRHRSFEFHGPATARPLTLPHQSHRGHLTIGWRHGCLRTVEPSVCPKHERWCRGTVYGVYGKGGGKPSVADAQRALGIDWMTGIEDLNEAIPPAYTEYIGQAFMAHLIERRSS